MNLADGMQINRFIDRWSILFYAKGCIDYFYTINNKQKHNIMETFIIIDCRGARHATIKAKSRKEAMEKYASDIPNGIVMAINMEDLEVFKANINNL